MTNKQLLIIIEGQSKTYFLNKSKKFEVSEITESLIKYQEFNIKNKNSTCK